MNYLGIDIGTSFLKGAVLDLDSGALLHSEREPVPAPIDGTPPRHCEMDPDAVVAAVARLLDRLLAHDYRCEGLIACSQMHTFVLVGGDGKARSNYYSWRDQRALERHPSGEGSYLDVLRHRLGPDTVVRLGNELRQGLPIATLFHLAELKALPTEDVTVASIGDYVLGRLTGKPVVSSATNGAAFGFMDMSSLRWDKKLPREIGCPQVKLPPLVDLSETPYVLQRSGQSLRCHAPVGDQQCAIVGASLLPGELSVNVSTGSQVGTLLDRLQLGDYQTRPFFDDRFLNTVTHIPAGRAMAVLFDVLTEIPRELGVELPGAWDRIGRLVEQVETTDLRVGLSFFGSIVGDRGHIENAREENLNVGHIFHAAFQDMAENFEHFASKLSAEGFERLVFSGGVAHKFPTLRRLVEQRFSLPSRLCSESEDTMSGLGTLARVAAGGAPSVAHAITAT